MTPSRILAVDDQPENLELLEAVLTDRGYEVLLASDGVEAIEIAERDAPQAILLDVMMPRLDGIGVLRHLKAKRPTCFVPIVVLTALADVENKVLALDAGADDFLTKPFSVAELTTRLATLLKIRRLRDELDSSEAILFSMIELLEGKSTLNAQHSLRVARIVAACAECHGIGGHERSDLVLGAALHDLGKIGIPEEWIDLPESKLGEDALARLRQHVEIGPRILQPVASLAGVLPYLRHHHERFDGSGYPSGLSGDGFPLQLELVAAANAWDRARSDGDLGERSPDEFLRVEARAGRFRTSTVDLVLRCVGAADRPLGLEALLPAPRPSCGGRILLADDSATNRQLYEEILGNSGYETRILDSGRSVLEAWKTFEPDLVLLDVRMPETSGTEICRSIKEDPAGVFLPVLLVTAYEDRGVRQRALLALADDILIAPVHRLELLARIRSLLRLKLYHQDLTDRESVIYSLSGALEAKDPWIRGHSERVGEVAAAMAQSLGLGPDTQDRLRLAGLLHDLGKVGVPERILHKAGTLTPEEWEAVASHPEIGFRICRRLRSAQPVLDAIRFHHERLDGSGYPLGLRGEQIPFEARLLALADAYEALTSERPYRRRLGSPEALALLEKEAAEGKWDPGLLAALGELASRWQLSDPVAHPGP